MIGTTAALILGGALGGSQVVNAVLGHKAAGKAAEQLQEGVKEARDYAEPKYAEAQRLAAEQHAQGRADLSPYAQAGAGGISALSQFLGVPAAAPARPAAAPMATAPSAPLASPMTPLSAVGRGAPSLEAPGRPPAAQQASQSSYVTLRAPTGQTRPVPADQVAYFLARGATRA